MPMSDKLAAERQDAQTELQRLQHEGGDRQPLNEDAALARARAAQDIMRDPEMDVERGPGRERVPFGDAEQQLHYEAEPGFHLHWFNDVPGRIARAKKGGYEHVMEHGEPVSRNVGRGDQGRGLKAFLMKIPQRWYEEDLAASQDALGQRLRDIKEGRLNAQPGSNQYVPNTGIRIDTGRNDRR